MLAGDIRVVLAVDSQAFRQDLHERLSKEGFRVVALDRSDRLLEYQASSKDVIVLETADDVAAMVNTVYELYRKPKIPGGYGIIAIASQSAITENESIAFWLIGARAAVSMLVSRESFANTNLTNIIRRCMGE